MGIIQAVLILYSYGCTSLVIMSLLLLLLQLWVNATQKFQLNSFVSQNVDTFEQLFVKVRTRLDLHHCVAETKH